MSPVVRTASFEGVVEPDFDGEYYTSWQRGRIAYLRKVLGADYFAGKRVIELAAGYGHIGREIMSWGAEVTCVDGRQAYVDEMRARGLPDVRQADLDRDFSALGTFDLVINFGILYHLTEPFQHLACCRRMLAPGGVMLLEAVVVDDFDCDARLLMHETGYDQSLSGRAVYLPPAAIERHLDALGLHWLDISSGEIHPFYDWDVSGSGGIKASANVYFRKMWLTSPDAAFVAARRGFARPRRSWSWVQAQRAQRGALHVARRGKALLKSLR
jgi:SAM-dependent methyltransferase